MLKSEFDLGYIMLNSDSGNLVYLHATSRGKRKYEEKTIAQLYKHSLSNDYDLMQLLCDKLFYKTKQEINPELKQYNHVLKALKKGAHFEVLRKFDEIRLAIPSAVAWEEKWIRRYAIAKATNKEILSATYDEDKHVAKQMKGAFQDAFLQFGREMQKKSKNPLYVSPQWEK